MADHRASTPYREAAPQPVAPAEPPGIHPTMVTVTETLHGHRITHSLGVVHGVAIQQVTYPSSLGVADMIEANLRARREALAQVMRFAAEMGANAVVGVRYDTAKLSETATEFLAYGTAVRAEP